MKKQKIILNKRSTFYVPRSTNCGFTLVFAVLVAGFLAVIGASIVGLALKGLDLASSARESHTAFYAADAGVECAMYQDLQEDRFAKPGDTTKETPKNPIKCNGQNIIITAPAIGETGTETITNHFQFKFVDGSCIIVDVIKNDVGRDGFNVKTTIMSRGRNVSCSGRKPIMVERGLKAEYSY